MAASPLDPYVPLTTDGTTLILRTDDGSEHVIDPDTPQGMAAIAPFWTRTTWSNGMFTDTSWLGVPMMQLPEDVMMLQEVFWEVRPTVVVETGVARGGSAVFWSSLLAMSGGREVVAVDITIPREVRQAVEEHPVSGAVRLVEGDSVDPRTVDAVRARIHDDDRVLVVLDSNHSREHVVAELEAYGELVTPGSYVVVTDGVMQVLTEAERGELTWRDDNPLAAAERWLERRPPFVRDTDRERLGATYFPGGWLRRDGPVGERSRTRRRRGRRRAARSTT